MSQGEEGDIRQFRRMKKNDYYALKGAEEYRNPTSFPICECCGSQITGKAYLGSVSGKFLCFRCYNER